MEYKIYNKSVKISIFELLSAYKINRDLHTAMNMIIEADLCFKIYPEIHIHNDAKLFATIKYKDANDTSLKSKYYIFNGRFKKKDFYNKVIKQYI